jgi:hypothetical protein
MSSVIKCKFCDWQCKKGWTNNSGKYVSGQSNLMDHIMKDHQSEYLAIQDVLDNDLELIESGSAFE